MKGLGNGLGVGLGAGGRGGVEAEVEALAEAEAKAGRRERAPLATSRAALTAQPWTAMSLAVLDNTARSPVPGKAASSAR